MTAVYVLVKLERGDMTPDEALNRLTNPFEWDRDTEVHAVTVKPELLSEELQELLEDD